VCPNEARTFLDIDFSRIFLFSDTNVCQNVQEKTLDAKNDVEKSMKESNFCRKRTDSDDDDVTPVATRKAG
jgi:hypothetical protein